MIKRFLQLFFVIVGGTLGFVYVPDIIEFMFNDYEGWMAAPYTGAIFGALLFLILTFWFVDSLVRLIKLFEEKIVKAPVTDVLCGTLGLVSGLIVAFLFQIPLNNIKVAAFSTVLPIFLTVFLGYLGFQIGFKKREELKNLFMISKAKDKRKETQDHQPEKSDEDIQPTGHTLKILDTSVIIDGRIADICQTGFLEGTLVIPQFVLEELQHIADSSDVLKRNRGRRGLDILNKIQKELPVHVEIYEGDFEDIAEVDSKLVKLAKLVSGIVVTNDFNLNKVCDLQGVSVFNINDLANAVKPVVLPGEELEVQLIKDGKEHNQGVGYLDDGTMIVVEEGQGYIGKTIDVIVTSVLQTSAGRMIFAKPKLMEQAL
ncbi:PIN/TRAM domain-containing protein [Tuberibacillus sp. Marseille-P3662]|uniref:PIN/TRAM domain-containing protein n=1 Tax=Tuberibacillus sp. Marseille-P3662 TaxID=1965358 RepID=UPI000A1CC12C|nr:PIN/TRAM domain-containing protein [Tuberibacillus sp. Marseille-P3662]